LPKFEGERAAASGGSAEIAHIENGQALGVAPEELAKGRDKFRLAILAEPLHLLFVKPRTKTQKLGDPRMKPTQGIGKPQSAQRPDLLVFSHSDQPGPHVTVFIEGEDQGAIEFRRVKSASGMTEMMLEFEERSRFANQTANLAELCKFAQRCAERTRPIRGAGPSETQAQLKFCFAQGPAEQATRRSNNRHIRKVHAALLEAPLDRQSWSPGTAG